MGIKEDIKMKIMIIAMILCGFAVSEVSAKSNAKVIDGDSIVVNGVEMRVEGIDAPEYKQLCQDENKQEYRCGIKAKEYMKNLLKNAEVHCKNLGVDRYKRQISVCYVGDKDINAEMVKAGWAVAYDRYNDAYVEIEKQAKKNKQGIWKGKFMKPELWRRLKD